MRKIINTLGLIATVFILTISYTLTHPTDINAQVTTENLSISSKNGKMSGQLFSNNSQDNNHPLVIFSHGLGGSQEDGYPYARYLARQGYATYTYTFNHGSADSDMTKMSIFTEERDLKAVISHFKNQGYRHFILVGASQGGVVSAMTAADVKGVSRLVLLYPAFTLKRDNLSRFPNHQFPRTFNLMGMTLGREYLKDCILQNRSTQLCNIIIHSCVMKKAIV